MISFNSNNLETAYLLVNKLNRFSGADRDLQTEYLSFQNGFEIVTDFYRSRTITIGGTIDATSSAHLADLIDTMKQNLSGINNNLDVDYGSGTRRYKATLSNFKAPEEYYNITHLPYTAEFLCKPFGYATSTTTISGTDITASSYSDSDTITGTYKPQPVITITLDTASDVTSVAFKNNTTGDQITIEETFSTSDILIINTETHKVTLNGTQIDFSGPIPEFSIGSNSFTVDVGSTSHQYDLSIVYTPTYL